MQHHRWREKDLLNVKHTGLSREAAQRGRSVCHHAPPLSSVWPLGSSPFCSGWPHTLPTGTLNPRHVTHSLSLGWQVRIGETQARQRGERETGRWVYHGQMGDETPVKTLRKFRLRERTIYVLSGWSLNHVWLCDPMDCSLPGSSVRGRGQARILEWVAIPFSTRSSWPRNQTQVFFTAGIFFTVWDVRETPIKE